MHVVFVHGIGEQGPSDYDAFGQALTSHTRNRAPNRLIDSFRVAYWADVLQPDEDRLKTVLGRRTALQEFMIGSLGDVVAYGGRDRYEAIRGAVLKTFLAVPPNEPVAVVAHSLGTVIASDAIYDIQKGLLDAKTLEQLQNRNFSINLFVTMGCPIALYGLRYGFEALSSPIRVPCWVNVRYPQDVVGFPLRSVNDAYRAAVTEDVLLEPGGLSNWWGSLKRRILGNMPLIGIESHSWYLSDQRVTKLIFDHAERRVPV